jgi:hypothetical protein
VTILAEVRNDEMPPRGKIFYYEDTDEGMVTDSLLLFRVQNQFDEVMVVNWVPKKQHHMRGVSPSLRLSNLELAEAQFTNGTAEGKKMEF